MTALASTLAPFFATAMGLLALGGLVRVMWRFVRLSVHAFETIAKELNPNGGGSTYDLVRDLKARFEVLESNVALADAANREAIEASDLRCITGLARAEGAVESLERRLVEVTQQTGRRTTDLPVVHLAPPQQREGDPHE